MTESEIMAAAERGAHRGALLAQATIAEIHGKTVLLSRVSDVMGVSRPTARKRTLHLAQNGKLPEASVLRMLADAVR